MNDGKHYLNIFETLPDGRWRFWIQFGLAVVKKDIYIFDPCLNKGVHFSLHRDGNIHIRNGNQREKHSLFRSEWFADPKGKSLKQIVYFRPAADSYPIVTELPNTPRTINHQYVLFDGQTSEHRVFPNMVFKFLLGPLTATTYHSQHLSLGQEIDTFSASNWIVGVTPIIVHPREDHDNGTFLYIFNTKEDILDSDLFTPSIFEIGPKSMTSQFIISKKEFPQGEVACIYYRL